MKLAYATVSLLLNEKAADGNMLRNNVALVLKRTDAVIPETSAGVDRTGLQSSSGCSMDVGPRELIRGQ